MRNVFEDAKFGDRYQCRNGMQAVFVNDSYGMVTLLINDDDTKEDWLCNYDPDGRSDCDEEWDIVPNNPSPMNPNIDRLAQSAERFILKNEKEKI